MAAVNLTIESSDTDNIQYSKSVSGEDNWDVYRRKDFSGGSMHMTSVVGASANFTITGTAFTIMGDKVKNHGYFLVRINGKEAGTYDAWADQGTKNDTYESFEPLFTSEVMDFGSHNVEYINLGRQGDSEMGQFMVLDVIQVQVSNPEDASSTLVTDDPDASIIASIPPDSSENSSSSSSDDDGASAGTIAGAVVGTLAGVALLLYAAYMLFWRPRQRQRVESGTTHMGPQDGGDSSTHFHSGQESRSPASTFVPSSNMVTTASGAPSSSGHHYHPQSSTLRPASTIDTQSNPSSLTYAQPVQPRDIGSSLVIQNNSEQEHVGGPAPLAPGEYPAPPPMHVQSCSIFSPKLTFEHHRYSRASSSDPKGHFDSQYRPSQSVQ